MTRVIRAELFRLVRRRTVVVGVVGAVLLALVSTLTVFSSASAGVAPTRGGATSLATLAGAGGGTEAFAVGASFVGFLVFVSFIALIGADLSGGTFRALLLREPHRLRVIVGKLVATLLVAAGIVAVAEVATFLLSIAVAPTQDVATASWLTWAGAGEALRDYATVLAGVAGWAVFGTMLAVVFRSVPVALGVGFAWAGPFENIVVDSWDTGLRVFPGQVLGSLIQGGTGELALGPAVATTLLYTAIAAAVALVLLSRRDVAG